MPVGIGQSWLEERQSLATEQDYLELVGLLLFVGIGAYLMWSIDQARWFEIAMAAIAGFAALLNLALKLRARFL